MKPLQSPIKIRSQLPRLASELDSAINIFQIFQVELKASQQVLASQYDEDFPLQPHELRDLYELRELFNQQIEQVLQ